MFVLARLVEYECVDDRQRAREDAYYAMDLGERFWGIRPTPAELDALITGLIQGLELPDERAGSAAFGLKRSGRMSALPALTAMLRRWAKVDPLTARQPVIAIWDIVEANANSRQFTPEECRVVDSARKALRYVARTAADGPAHCRSTASDALQSLGETLRRTQPFVAQSRSAAVDR